MLNGIKRLVINLLISFFFVNLKRSTILIPIIWKKGGIMNFNDIIHQNYEELSDMDLSICQFVIENKSSISNMSITDFARKSLSSKSTPRARFEALSIGISLALEENEGLEMRDISGWIDGEEFAIHTKSDAANNKKRLMGRIEFVKEKLLLGE